MRRGAAWFSSIGRKNNTGPKLMAISGHIQTPCVFEEALGLPLKEIIERHGGGVRGGWDNLLAVIPGGTSMPMLNKEVCDTVIMDFDGMREVGSGLGTAGIVVMDKSTDLIRAITRISQFYKHESCGQCTPCREGSNWVLKVMKRMTEGRAEIEEIDMLMDVTKQIENTTICAMGMSVAWPVQALIRNFRPMMEQRIMDYKKRHGGAVQVQVPVGTSVLG